jgi:3-oxoacyl-(acyl-carrier-protein) synthase
MNRYAGQHETVALYYQTLWDKGPSAVSGLQFVQSTANAVLGQIALDFRLRGPSLLNFGPFPFDCALDILRQDRADVVLTGAVDEFSEFIQAYFDAWGLTPSSQGRPEEMRVYSRGSAGFLGGDGALFFVLETLKHAKERRADILGYLRGCSNITDRAGPEDLASRHAEDIAEAIARGLGDARLEWEDIGMISGAANGLEGFDSQEITAVSSIFRRSPWVTASKGALGETFGIAGALAAMVALLALKHRVIPPTINTDSTNINGSIRLVTDHPEPLDKQASLSLSYDFSGQDSAYLFSSES